MFTVAQQARISAPVTQTWEYLTRPSLLTQWFADAECFEMEKSFRLDFGDGDFFVGTVRECQKPSLLRIEWKFMGIGPLFEIGFRLSPSNDAETTLHVLDRGALTQEESDSLQEGWEDFLSRLTKFARTGQSTRYVWSRTFGAGVILKTDMGGRWPAELCHQDWWQQTFSGCVVQLREHSADTLLVGFSEAAWGGAETEARLSIKQFDFGAYLGVTHEGWTRLPEAQQMRERRRYAGLWLEGLKSLEDEYRRTAMCKDGNP
jgi:uncharacterized protein YndB with AHSA1/START domain